ncbi:MAG: hybrid sensor histidine kinase/response regulator [Alphaproteobacteria bacterium]|nr:hybrid sensor histidine kinase/response regulator [Alphaproteobacteria bacterium]
MGALMRAHDWSDFPLGPPAGWPEGLKIPLRMMLSSRFEMWLGWGPDLNFFYNDAYRPTLGIKHPGALGQPMRQVWKEVFDAVQDRIQSVMARGVPTWDEALLLLLERRGYPEETYHTFSYSPLYGSAGAVEGLLCVVSEETERVITERRLGTLSTLAGGLIGLRSRDAVAAAALTALGENRRDFPFSLIYLFDAAKTVTGAYADMGAQALLPVFQAQAASLVGPTRIALHDGGLPSGDWAIPPREMLLVPIAKAGQGRPLGVLALGLNPYRPGDAEIESFAGLVAGQLAGAFAEIETRDSERSEIARLQEMFAQSPSFTAILRGPQHRFELTNPAYIQLVGHRDVIGRTVREALPEVEEQGFPALLDNVFRTGETFVGRSMTVLLVRTPGAPPEPRILDFVFQPMRDAAGAVSGIFVEGIDITSAHEADTARQESEAQFRTFAQAMPNHVWAATPDGQLDWFNEQTLAYSGLCPEDLVGDRWAGIVHPGDLEAAAAAWADALGNGRSYETEFRIRRADGVYRWHLVRSLPIRDADGAITRWVGTNTDIQDQKEASEALRQLNVDLEQEVVARSMATGKTWQISPDLLGIANAEGFFENSNPGWQALLGWSREEIARTPLMNFVHPDDLDRTNAALTALINDEPVLNIENRYRSKDGSYRWISWVAVPENGKFYCSGRDVTAEKERESQLAEAEEALRQAQKMEAVGQLTGGIAHDFNNLLQGITGALDRVQHRISEGRVKEVDRFLKAAVDSANRAAALTHRLLAFSRRQTLDPRALDLNRLIAGMEDLIRRTMGPTVQVEVVGAGGLWPIRADGSQLENSLLNLCINARDAMPDGGRLTIETANKWLDARAAKDRELPPGQYVSLCVTDSGTGMAPEVIARAFDPFFTTKPLGQGTGLGLSMIYGFVRQSGGQVRIYSEEGKGTTMCLYFPRHLGTVEDEVSEASQIMERGFGETVLVVDDEPTVRMLIAEVLSESYYRILEAGDGLAALKILETGQRIDLLITDVGLPGGMNGRQVADAARVLRAGLKVLFITGYAENAAVGNGHLDPGMEILAKPFAMSTLANKVREMIER